MCINFSYCQNYDKINISNKNQVHGIVITSTASSYTQNRVTVTTSILNSDPDFNLRELEYKIILKGKGGKVLKDTTVVIKPSQPDSEYSNTPEKIIRVAEINGKVITDTFENPEYLINLEKISEKTLLIKPKGVYVSSVLLIQKNIVSIEIKSLKANLGHKTYYAPGY
jgi:hypothetical protein